MQTPAELASGQHLYSAAQFTDEDPGPNDQCPVTNSSWAPAKQTFTAVAAEPAGPMGMPPALPALPQDSWEYDWSNMQVYVTAADQGVQFAADLTLTETDGTGTSCSMQYHAIGLWPDVSCSRQIEDGSFVADLDMCNPCAEPLLGRATGSGISPDALTDCVQLFSQDDPRGPYYCVLHGTNDPPVLNPAPPTCEGTVMSLGNGTGGAPGMGAGGMGGAPGAGGAGGAGGSSSDAGTDGPADASGE
jgi:hypothetical protein